MRKNGHEHFVRRYQMTMPAELYDELLQVAEAHGDTVQELVKKFIKLGLLVVEVAKIDGHGLFLHEGDLETEVTLW